MTDEFGFWALFVAVAANWATLYFMGKRIDHLRNALLAMAKLIDLRATIDHIETEGPKRAREQGLACNEARHRPA